MSYYRRPAPPYYRAARSSYYPSYRAARPSSYRAVAPRRRSTMGFDLSTPFGSLKGNYNSKKKGHLASGASSSRAVRAGVRRITAPVAVGTSTRRIAPQIAGSKSGQLCFKNREAIASLTVTDPNAIFETHSFVINPGLPIFPLASNLAKCFQRYNMRCKFFFETTQPSSSQGQSLIIVNRNVQDPVPQTFPEFSSFMGCVTNPIWTNVECPGSGYIESNDKFLYTRDAPIPDSGDSLMYDFCRISVAFSNLNISGANINPTQNNVGTLWCEYEICFDGPKLTQSITTSTFTTSENFLTDDVVDLPYAPAGDPGTAFAQVNFISGNSAATYVPNVLASGNTVFTPGEVSGIVFSQPGYYMIETYCAIGSSSTDVFGFGGWAPYLGENSVSSTLVSSSEVFMSGESKFVNTSYINIAEPATVDEMGNIIGLGAITHDNINADEPPAAASGDPFINQVMITVNPIDQQTVDLLGLIDIGGGTFVPTVSASFDHKIHGSRRNLVKRNAMMKAAKQAKEAKAKAMRSCDMEQEVEESHRKTVPQELVTCKNKCCRLEEDDE